MAKKKVRITLEMDTQFVKLLWTNVQLKREAEDRNPDRCLDARGVLARLVVFEARGALPHEVAESIPFNWRENIKAVSEERKVQEV